ncbi:MAG: hypothetical protein HQK60_01285 [Deltaproteobacteria bacterium]|nr:hypothetical protein [Deltaproteobacteria bacterium]
MPAKTVEHVKGSELPTGLLEKLGFLPQETFRITVEPEYEDDGNEFDVRPFAPEFLEAMKRSEEDAKAGRVTKFDNVEDLFAHLDQIAHEDD